MKSRRLTNPNALDLFHSPPPPVVTALEAFTALDGGRDPHSGDRSAWIRRAADIVLSPLTPVSFSSPPLPRPSSVSPPQVTIVIGCWATTADGMASARAFLDSFAFEDGAIFSGGDAFSPQGGQRRLRRPGPVVAEAVRHLQGGERPEMPGDAERAAQRGAAKPDSRGTRPPPLRPHVAFQHLTHLHPRSLYVAPTCYLPHNTRDMQRRVMYSGVATAAEAALYTDTLAAPRASSVDETGEVKPFLPLGALRDQLAVLEEASQRAAQHLNVRVLFLGGGHVAAGELRGLLQLGNAGLLPSGTRWSLIVANVPHARYKGDSIVTQAAAEELEALSANGDAAAAWAAGAEVTGPREGSGSAFPTPVYTFTLQGG